MIDKEKTLGQLATAVPAAAKVFYRHGLDYCCGGNKPLATACAEHGLDVAEVLAELQAAATTAPATGASWAERPIPELILHILQRYHEPLKLEIPRLVELAFTVERVHAGKPGCPAGLANHLAEMRRAVDEHLLKEEQILFPMILAGRGGMARMPIQVMLSEHDDHGQALRRTRALTDDLQLPDGACAKWRELYRALEELEQELMDHIFLENSVLFPRALEGSGASQPPL
ncbi:MAG TPA: iron-sulfur cluster repair protein YtfE [Myxococcaceae bacterium]|nr:iron-sulfur cluster repair protein YtfE [Myxococcaceae bacterium]